MRKPRNFEVTCPNCGTEFDTDESNDSTKWKTSPETTETGGNDPDNIGAENSMNNTPTDKLTRSLIKAAQAAKPVAKANKPRHPAAEAADAEDASAIMAKAIGKARAERR